MANDQRDPSDQPPADQPAQPPANRWGDPISEERKAKLQALAGQQAQWAAQPEAGRGDSHFMAVPLTGAAVFWLAVLALAGAGGDTAAAEMRLRSALDDLFVRITLDLSRLHLEGADLRRAHLEGAVLRRAHLEGAVLYGAHLEGKSYPAGDAELERIRRVAADFPERLAPADLSEAFLDSATVLTDAVLVDTAHGAVRVVDVHWGG